MAQLTLQTYLDRLRDQLDAVSSSGQVSARWSDTILTDVIAEAFRDGWTAILGAMPSYRWAARSITAGATGTFAQSSLNSGSGDSAQYWYRILAITDGAYFWRYVDFADAPNALLQPVRWPTPERLWYQQGSDVQLLPPQAQTVTVYVSWTPTEPDALASTASTVDWPDGFHRALLYKAAQFALSKGGAELDSAAAMGQYADERFQQMLQQLARPNAQPWRMEPVDAAWMWGGG